MQFLGIDRTKKSSLSYIFMNGVIYHSRTAKITNSEIENGAILIKKNMPIVRLKFNIIERFGSIYLKEVDENNRFKLSQESLLSILSFIEQGLIVPENNCLIGLFLIEHKYSNLYATPVNSENILIKESYDA